MANGKMDKVYGPVKTENEEADDRENAPRRRKVKNRILHLTELMPDATFQLVAQYGTSDQPMYVMDIEINGQLFQGIGPSKKRAKAMCADYALLHLGIIDRVEETPTDMVEYVDSPEDFTADITDQNTQLYYDFSIPETEQYVELPPEDFFADDDDDDDFMNELDDMTLQLLGKNPLTIMGELRPDAIYTLLDETGDPLHPKFLMSVTLDEETFQGSGPSKKLAKGRAARDALRKFYNLEFGTSENGMPIYEGDARIWQHFKAKLENKAQQRLDLNRDPVTVLQEFFPQIRYSHRDPAERDGVSQYTTIVSIFDEIYEGVGPTKKDSKAVAAANTLNALRLNGVLAAKEKEVEADRKAASILPRIPSLFESEKKSVPVQRNAVAKLNLLYPNLEYELLAEKPVRNTLLTAFVMAVSAEGRSFAGVGKTKKAAKVDAAEKALRYLRMWTKEDEMAKEQTLAEDKDPVASISKHREFHEAKKARLMQGNWGPGPDGNFWGGPGPEMGWRNDMGVWGENQMGWAESPGPWGGHHWGNRGDNAPNFMGGGGSYDMPEMGQGFGGDRGNFGPRRPFNNQGRGMGPRGFDAGFGPRGAGSMDNRSGNFYGEGMHGDNQRFRGPGGSPGGFTSQDMRGKGGSGRGGMRMPGGGGTAGGHQKRYPSPTLDGNNSGFGGSQMRPSGQPANMRPTAPNAIKPAGGGYRPQSDNSTTGAFRPGNPRTPTATARPIQPGMAQDMGGSGTKPVGATGLPTSPGRGIQKSASSYQAGVAFDNYQYGAAGGGTTSNKAADVSGTYPSSLGASRMYYPEGYQSSGTGVAGYQQQSMSNLQTGTSMNYSVSSYQTTTAVPSSGYTGTTYVGSTYNDSGYMTGSACGTGYYGGYSGAVGSVQGYGYDYMTGYQVATASADPNYNMSNYSTAATVSSAGYYPGYDYTQTGATAGTMNSYSGTDASGSSSMKSTW